MSRVEPLRTADRLRLTYEISDTDETFAIHPVTTQVLHRASETFPTVVGILDAIHLATAFSIREIEKLDSLLTHDSQFGTAARSLGFEVIGMMNKGMTLL